MNRFSTAWLPALLWAALAGTIERGMSAQEPRAAAAESLEAWPWRQELQLPEAGAGRLFELTVPPAVFDKATPDLIDLRLADAKGKPVPYALRVRRTELQQVPVKVQRPFNRTTNAAGHYAELSLALEDDGPVLHNEVEVATAGTNFRRTVHVYGSDSDRLDKAERIADKYLVRYVVDGRSIDLRKVRYDLSRYQYLKVRVYADPSNNEDVPRIEGLAARRTSSVAGVYQTLPLQLGPREAVPGDGGPGSAWLIELSGRENMPWERLSFDVIEEEFVRSYRLEAANPDEPRQVIARGDWRRGTAGQRPAGERQPLEIELAREGFARRLRLVVTDFANPPLSVTGARSIIPARQVVFELPRDRQYALPLWLYFGNAKATPPNYDFARALPGRPQQQTVQTNLNGQVERNPAYRPPPLPLSERWPWLIYVVLGAASLVLLGILAMLARQAMARHDAEHARV